MRRRLGRSCFVEDCPLPLGGELSLWWMHGDQPLTVALCSVHMDTAVKAIGEKFERAREKVK